MFKLYRNLLQKGKTLFHPSGGLMYHYLYWRYGNKLWRDYREQLDQTLLQIEDYETLVLVGSSAAYCLSSNFLKKFDKIIVFEPDELALSILKKRHCVDLFDIQRADHLFSTSVFAQDLLRYLEHHCDAKNSLILFNNILGQWSLIAGNNYSEQSIADSLQNDFVNWNLLSIHDRFSFSSGSAKLKLANTSNSEAEFFKFCEENDVDSVYDHMTQSILQNSFIKSFLWNILPGRYHLIYICYRKLAYGK